MKWFFNDLSPEAYQNYLVDFPEMKNIIKTGNLENAKAICPNPKYAEKVRYCAYASQCFRPDRAAYLKKKRKEYIKFKNQEKKESSESKMGE